MPPVVAFFQELQGPETIHRLDSDANLLEDDSTRPDIIRAG